MKNLFTNVQLSLRETRKGWRSICGPAREHLITLDSIGEGVVTGTKKLPL